MHIPIPMSKVLNKVSEVLMLGTRCAIMSRAANMKYIDPSADSK